MLFSPQLYVPISRPYANQITQTRQHHPQLRAARDELMRLNAAAERVAVQQREEVPYCILTV